MAHTSQNTSGFKSFTATATAIAAFARVKVDSAGLILVSDAANDWIGTTIEPIAASGTGTVRLKNSGGTHQFIASAAITRGNILYPTASGKVDDAGTTGGAIGFVALEAAGADLDVIEAAPTDSEGALAALGEGQNLVLGTATGTKIGTAASQKLGLWNATPVVQPSSADQTAVTDNTGGSVADAIAAVVTAPTEIGATLTDSTGLDGSHNDTVSASVLLVGTLGGAADGTMESISDTSTGDRSTQIMNNLQDILAAITVIRQNESDMTQKIIELVTAQAADRLAIVALTDGLAKTIELTNALRTALVNTGIVKGSA